MKTLDLRNLTGDARNAALNEAVAVMEGWESLHWAVGGFRGYRIAGQSGEVHESIPPYATSCDAVMPLLVQYGEVVNITYSAIHGRWSLWIMPYTEGVKAGEAFGKTLAEAASIALLRAHSVEVLT